jgi:pSer/pThr/pTyr-binding forkhead associated (FHA) protein
MPLIRCPKCQQAYDVPAAVAVRLPNSIATCHCGEWLAGSKAAVLARLLNPEEIREVDLQPYKVNVDADGAPIASWAPPVAGPDDDTVVPSTPRSIRVIARGNNQAVDTVFTIGRHPLWIGRNGCHVELADAELSIRHCSIRLHNGKLIVRDADSHMGTFFDGQQIDEAVIEEGIHLLRVGSALVTVEPTEAAGAAVERIALGEPSSSLADALHSRSQKKNESEADGGRILLVCIEGPLIGQEFEIPPGGLVVGREGHVAVPDEFLSRKHFEVVADDDGTVRVRDLGSRNGTFLNTLPARNTKVHKGDEIRAGVNAFRIEQRT